jgi:hypothetical protein
MDILDDLFELFVVVAIAAAAPMVSALIPKIPVPQVVILILGGIVIGPAGLGLEDTEALQLIANVGLGFVFLLAGFEIEPALLIDLHRRRLKVRELVHLMEQAIIDTLADRGLAAARKDGAPGVYVDGAKIAALGLRVRNGCSYHGLAVNVEMDLAPFSSINPCGYEGLRTVQLRDFGIADSVDEVGARLLGHLERLLPPRPAAGDGQD